jgi:hypothetical protein
MINYDLIGSHTEVLAYSKTFDQFVKMFKSASTSDETRTATRAIIKMCEHYYGLTLKQFNYSIAKLIIAAESLEQTFEMS